MSTTCAAVVLLGILITDPASGFASTRSSDSQSATTQVARAVVAMYATRGVVKSVDATSLVITRSAMKRNDMVFVLNPATQREGDVAIGSMVEVRYRTEKKQQVATAIRVREHRS